MPCLRGCNYYLSIYSDAITCVTNCKIESTRDLNWLATMMRRENSRVRLLKFGDLKNMTGKMLTSNTISQLQWKEFSYLKAKAKAVQEHMNSV